MFDSSKNGVSLEELGVNNCGLTKLEALEVLSELESNNTPLLGGDVYLKNGKEVNSTYDNWYCDRIKNESIEEFVTRSLSKAKEYIMSYKNDSSGEVLFALVI